MDAGGFGVLAGIGIVAVVMLGIINNKLVAILQALRDLPDDLK